ncbi:MULTISPECIES: hypothetical protein [unclassified Curtobacterium]|uniref:hypothetical protein n=1 Tax=unclassified Curtobacterium TaxID=257496 RepID=UPI0008DD921F|nr:MULTISPECIES: hypothetical protein [unclassified Curtobacterium]OIH92933.1 hypothetical protein BIU92_08540 [Curtobacterium sp. MCBA15_003]OII29846.1 hypothetical protein BIU94_09280 [Curtobacterium sp. MMLR14_006]
MQALGSLARVAFAGFGLLAIWLLTTADGRLSRVLTGIGCALLAAAAYVGQDLADRAARNRQLDDAVARKDEWEAEHRSSEESER